MADDVDNDFRIEYHGETVLVRLLAHELTMFHLPELRADVLSLLKDKPLRLLFDFTTTAYIDSSAIALLFKVQNEIVAAGGQMGVCGLRAGLRKVLQTVVRDGGIQFYDSAADALNA